MLTYVKCQVRHSSLRASAALLLSSDEHQLALSASLLSSMLDTLPSVPRSQFPQVMSSLNHLVTLRDNDLDEWLEADVRLCLFANNYCLMELTQAIDNIMDGSYARVCK